MHRLPERTCHTPSTNSGRRPFGLSRREKQRPKQRRLGFEPLEDRQMLAAESPLAALRGAVADDIQIDVQSISSAASAGQLAILQNELYWQSLIAAAQTVYQGSESTSLARSIPTDPLTPDQWHLINSGQEVGNPDFQAIFAIPNEDINVAPVWNQGITGNGVVVAVIDSGVQTDHPDLADNISPTLQLNALNGNNNGNPISLDDAHGTAVAGLIGAIADNEVGGSGVAPGVVLAPIQLIGGTVTEQSVIDAFRFATDEIDITNNSWGSNVPRAIYEPLAAPTPDQILALRDSIIFGRDGLGVIHLFASGNSAATWFDPGFPDPPIPGLDSASFDGWVNTRYTIGVTGVDHDGFYNNVDGTVTAYPEAGTSVLVAAPTASFFTDIGNDSGIGSGIYTTDTTGENGYNFAPDPDTGQEFDRDYLADTDYTSRFNGTSAAAPIATGVVALMLEANPNLSWRDAQEILVRSARQNAEFDVPENGLGLLTQNTWITNQMPMFHDPDPWDPTIDPSLQTFSPTLDPSISFDPGTGNPVNHYQPTPIQLTNSAGYTVGQGRGVYGEEIGYAHGVVDAELAVQLAQQWQTKNQALPNELTFTTYVNPAGSWFDSLPAAEKGGIETGWQLVPGGLGGRSGFINFWNEYFADDPFADLPNPEVNRGGFIEFTVPGSNAMTVETVEVKLSIEGGTKAALDNLRIMLISPDGTQSDLNDFFIPDTHRPFSLQNISPATFLHPDPGSSAGDSDGLLAWTYSTNRSWGERSDDSIIFDATTSEPSSGNVLNQGWQLHFENYSTTSLQVTGIEMIWHGSPIGANTQRVQGLIGVDDNRDDLFNFSRVIQQAVDIDGDPTTLRYGEVLNAVDLDHESMAENITVTARRVSDNVVVDQFVTGADGNYYFDLVPDNYIISMEDPLGRTAADDSITPAGFLQQYQSEWEITTDFFKVWDYDANLDVPVDGTGTPFAWTDGGGSEQVYGMKHINFLLDPGPPPLPQVEFSGTVFADTNGDGLFNPDDVAVPEISVFGDVNRNGQFDAGEVLVKTDIDGQYNLVVPSTFTTVMNVGVIPPVDWTPTNPETGLLNFFVSPGYQFDGTIEGTIDGIDRSIDDPPPPPPPPTDFFLQPPAVSDGDGSTMPGYLLGVVFNDANGDARRQESESGVSGQRVYIDANNTGVIDAGDTVTTTNVHGGFVFADVPASDHIIRLEVLPPNEQTVPFGNGPLLVTLAGAGTISDLTFGVRNTEVIVVQPSTLDYGDLPDRYGVTTLFQDGARHVVGPWVLGQLVDTEEDGQPSETATLDDTTELADEDGIVFDPIEAGGSGRMLVTTTLYGGYLSGWMDFNGDGDFDDTIDGVSERLILTKAGGGLPETRTLLEGAAIGETEHITEITFDLPATIDATTLFARFRYGDNASIDTLTGIAVIGEVEDYALPVVVSLPLVTSNGPDLDADGDVDGLDFLAWQRGFGKPSGAAPAEGDANGDGAVDGDDLADILYNFGANTSQTASLVVESSDFDTDGDGDGSDFLAWQRGAGIATGASLAEGDANGDEAVNQADLAVWQNALGIQYAQGAQASSLALTIFEESQPNASEPYSVATLLGSQPAGATGVGTSYAMAGTTVLKTVDGETFDHSYSGDIPIIHHRRAGGVTEQALEALRRGSIPSSNRLSTVAGRTPSLRRVDPSRWMQPILTRLDRSIQTDHLGDVFDEETPTKDRALLELYGADRQIDRSPSERASHLRYAASRGLAERVPQHEAWLTALGEEFDWRR